MLFLRMWSTPIEKSRLWHRNLLDGRFGLETSQTNVETLQAKQKPVNVFPLDFWCVTVLV